MSAPTVSPLINPGQTPVAFGRSLNGRAEAARMTFGNDGPPGVSVAATWRTNLWLDAADTIAAVDEPWLAFARANDANELTRQTVVGRPLSDFIAGPAVVTLASPQERRFMTMTLRSVSHGGVHFEYVVDRTERRDEVPLFDRHRPRSEAIVCVCSWCRRLRHADTWQDVERVIAEADLFGADAPMPKMSHGICDECAAVLKGSPASEQK
jgi:hypothetical protein